MADFRFQAENIKGRTELGLHPSAYPLSVGVELPSRDEIPRLDLQGWAIQVAPLLPFVASIKIEDGHGDSWIVKVNRTEAVTLRAAPRPFGALPVETLLELEDLLPYLHSYLATLAPVNEMLAELGIAVEGLVMAWKTFAAEVPLSPDDRSNGDALVDMANEAVKTRSRPGQYGGKLSSGSRGRPTILLMSSREPPVRLRAVQPS